MVYKGRWEDKREDEEIEEGNVKNKFKENTAKWKEFKESSKRWWFSSSLYGLRR